MTHHILRVADRTAPYTYYDHVLDQEVTEQRVLSGVSWCGRNLMNEWFFLSAEHAKSSLDGGQQVCRKCWRAAVAAGAITPPETLTIDTWALRD